MIEARGGEVMQYMTLVVALILVIVGLVIGYRLARREWRYIDGGSITAAAIAFFIPPFWLADYNAIKRELTRTSVEHFEILGMFFGLSFVCIIVGAMLGAFVWRVQRASIG